MASRTRKRKSSTSDDPDAPPPPAKKVARPAQRAAVGKQRSPLEEYTVDEGRNGSRKFFGPPSTAKKRRKQVTDSKRELRCKTDEVIAFIDDQMSQFTSIFQTTTILDAPPPDLVAILPHVKASPSASTARSPETSVYGKYLQSLEHLQESIKEYEEINKRETKIKQGEKMRWEQDVQDLRELNNEAVKISADRVAVLIMPKPGPATTCPAADNMERVAWEMLEEQNATKGEMTWGGVAQELMTGFMGLLKLIPGNN